MLNQHRITTKIYHHKTQNRPSIDNTRERSDSSRLMSGLKSLKIASSRAEARAEQSVTAGTSPVGSADAKTAQSAPHHIIIL